MLSTTVVGGSGKGEIRRGWGLRDLSGVVLVVGKGAILLVFLISEIRVRVILAIVLPRCSTESR